MENIPLASLTLTHVHYVLPPPQVVLVQLSIKILIPPGANIEPRRPTLLRMRSPRPCTPSAMRHLRDTDMVDKRG